MNQEAHARAQQLMAAARVEGISASEQAWLEQHLEACAACAQDAARTARALETLRWVAVSADPALVRATQQRVRQRAYELAERRARLLPLAASCGLAALLGLAAVTSLWRGFAWLGELWGLPSLAWQAGFLSAWFLPTAVTAAVLFWLRPPAFNGSGKTMEWSPAPRGDRGGER
jgi:hypothetical protein